MSALRYAFVLKLVDCSAFDDPLLRTVKQGVANMPAPPHCVHVPCTLDMINHIIATNTTATATINNLILATGVALAYFLCSRSSEYVSKTIVPIDDSHQFRTTEVEFMLNDGSLTFIASNRLNCPFSAIKYCKSNSACYMQKIYDVIMGFSARSASAFCPTIIPLVHGVFAARFGSFYNAHVLVI
jgi:hypothetical protein